MADLEQLALIRHGAAPWNQWRETNPPYTTPDLSEADLGGANLSKAYLLGADLRERTLSQGDLSQVNLSKADLRMADLGGAKLIGFASPKNNASNLAMHRNKWKSTLSRILEMFWG